jgi:hypothetical protein
VVLMILLMNSPKHGQKPLLHSSKACEVAPYYSAIIGVFIDFSGKKINEVDK